MKAFLSRSLFCLAFIITFMIGSLKAFNYDDTCSPSYFYDTNTLTCTPCASKSMVQSADGIYNLFYSLGFSCICPLSQYLGLTNSTAAVQILSCITCPSNSTASIDRSICITCPAGIDAVTQECYCPANNAVIEKDVNGNYLTVKQCVPCGAGDYPGGGAAVYACKACPPGKIYDKSYTPWQCVCDTTNYVTAGDVCFLRSDAQFIINGYPENSAKGLTLDNMEVADSTVDSSQAISSSDTISYLYLKAAELCLKQSDTKSCQVLANLCVLQMYDRTNPVCILYEYINNLHDPLPGATDLNQKVGMPWLYYKSTADKVINDTTRIQFEVSFDPTDTVNVNQLEFYLAKYDINGNFLGMDLLTTDLEFCTRSYEDGILWRSFGSTIVNKCDVDMSLYLSRNYTMLFYELYLMDPVTGKLVDIPIMIDNIRNAKASGAVNNANNATDPVDWILVRRFFTIDNLSGVTSGFVSGNTNAIGMRFPKLFKLIVLLQNTPTALIMVPYVEIFYKSKSAIYIATTPSTSVQFISEYRMSIASFVSSATAVFIVLNILIGFIVVMRMYIWYRLNPPTLSPVLFKYNF